MICTKKILIGTDMLQFTSKDVFAKRKAHQIDEAYRMAVQLINRPSHDEWDTRAFAWCVIDLIKRESSAGNTQVLDQYKQQLQNLVIPVDDEVLSSQRSFAINLCNPNRSVTSQDVFAKRKANQIDEAYNMAIELMSNSNHDEWDIRAFAWCVIDLIRRDSSNGNTANLQHYKQQLESIKLPDDEILVEQSGYALRLCNPNLLRINQARELNKQGNYVDAISIYWQLFNSGDHSDEVRYGLGWTMYKHSKQLLELSTPSYVIIRRYLNDFFKLSINPPKQKSDRNPFIQSKDSDDDNKPELYTYILRIADKLGSEDKIKMASFVRIWNLDNLVTEDFEQYIAEDGKSYLSLAEKVVQHATKDAISRDSLDDIHYLHPYIDRCMDKHPENIWLKMYKAKVLLALGNYDSAIGMAIKVIKEKSKEFWAWELIGDIVIHHDKEMALSAYCKALICTQDINFTSKVRVKLAKLLAEQEKYELAKTEIKSIVDFKTTHQHKIPEDVQYIMSEGWYFSSKESDNNAHFYQKNILMIETYIYHNLPWINAIVGSSYKLENKKTRVNIYIATDDIPTEISLPESKLQHLSSLTEGMGIKVKGEYDNQARFNTYLIETRTAEKNDIFSSHIGVVDNVNHQKKLIHYLIDKKIDGIVKFSELNDDFIESDSIELQLASYQNKHGKYYKAVYATKTTKPAPNSLIKNFNSSVSVSNNMGFTDDDIFISPPMISKHNIKDGDTVTGKAILNYNKKRREWGWRVVSINSNAERCHD